MMNRASVFLLVAAVTLAAPLSPRGSALFGSSPAWAAPESEEEQLIGRGVALRKAGSDQEATEIFRQAYQRFHSPRSAAQLGLSEHALGRWDDAEAHLVEALRADADPWIKKNRETLTRALAVVKEHIARLEVLGTPEGAEILVNGHVVGRLPMSTPVGTIAGEVDVETRAPGYKAEVRKLELKGGQYQRLVVRLERATGATVPVPTTATAVAAGPGTLTLQTQTPRESHERNPVGPAASESDPSSGRSPSLGLRKAAKWVALGLAVGGLGVGVGSSLVRSNKLDQLKTSAAGQCYDRDGRAVDASGTPVPACQGALDTYHAARPWQIVGFVSAGVFAATWVALLLTEPDDPAPPATAQATHRALSCGPSADLRGASCAFAF